MKFHRFALVISALIPPIPAAFAQNSTIVGLDALRARLGVANTPTGAGIVVGQVEAPSGGAYGPNQADAQFVGKSFTAQSGTPGVSSHATTVGMNLYGNVSSISPGVTQIHLWEAGNWVQGYLRVQLGSGSPPLTPPAGLKTFNHSWIGSFGSGAVDNEAIRRADFAVARDNILVFTGMNNSGSTPALMSSMYHGISVGRRDGAASSTDSVATVDGAGRMKPELVAPGNLTSFTTPVAAACGALLVETVRDTPALASNPNAEKADTLKAILLAGAWHEPGWSNNAPDTGPNRGLVTRSLDDELGAGTVNVNTSHMILTGGEQAASPSVPSGPTAASNGFHRVDVLPQGSVYWRFRLNTVASAASIAAAWHRSVPFTFGLPSVANFDLELWKVDAVGNLVSLVGDGGLGVFTRGNVASQSTIDNVEHLFIESLQPGDYVLELRRVDTLTSFPTWTAAVAWTFYNCAAGVVGDLNADNAVGEGDLGQLLASWQTGSGGDLDNDGDTDEGDLGILLSAWGDRCP